MPKQGPVHVSTIRRVYHGKTYTSHLLRHSYREGGRVKSRTVGNLSALPEHLVELVRRGLAGERFLPASGLKKLESRSHGQVAAVLAVMRELGFEKLLDAKPSRMRDLALGMVAVRLWAPASKLETTRLWKLSTLPAKLGVEDADEDDLYAALDWLYERQEAIQERLVKRHLKQGGLAYYDLSSSYLTGRHCLLAKLGYSRDGKKGTLQIEYGIVAAGEAGTALPVAVEVFAGNTHDAATVKSQVDRLQDRYGLKEIVIVGDRGMLTSARVDELRGREGLGWLTALRAPEIQALRKTGSLQLGLFDERNLAEITDPAYPGERLIVCRNPLQAQERARKREDLLRATEAKLAPIVERVAEGRLAGQDAIGLAVGKVIDRHKVGKHFEVAIKSDSLRVSRDNERIEREAALDGIYVLRTSLRHMDAAEVVRTYKRLAKLERIFRRMKSFDIQIRPVHHYTENRVRAHVFLCMLATYVQCHLEKRWAPLLFKDEQPPVGEDPVAPARRSPEALRKASRKRLPNGTPAHSYRTLIAALAQVTRDRMLPAGAPAEAAFDLVTTPDDLQARALELAGVNLQRL